MITASAGFLSAATGVMVALNQTGVVDLRQLAGSKPAAQTSPAEPQTATTPHDPASPGNKPAAAKPYGETDVVEAKREAERLPSAPRVHEETARFTREETQPMVEAKAPDSAQAHSSAAVGDARNPGSYPENRIVDLKNQEEQRSRPLVLPPSQDDERPTISTTRERVVETKTQVGTQVPSHAPADVAKPGSTPENRIVNVKKQEEQRSQPLPPPPIQDKVSRPIPNTAERVVEPKPQVGTQVPSPAPADVAKPGPSPENRIVNVKKQEEQRSQPLPPPPTQDKVSRPMPNTGERVVEPKPQAGLPATSAPTRDTKGPAPQTVKTVVETKKPEQKPPAPLPAQEKVASPRPVTKELVPEVKKSERSPGSPTSTDDDEATKSRISRQPAEAVAAAGKGKGLAVEPKPGKHKGPEGSEVRGAAATGANPQLNLTGLKMTVPKGWVMEEVQPSSMGPIAELKIPSPDASGAEGVVRITHYMGAKGKEMEDRYIDRWISQVVKPNGSAMSRADAKVATTQLGAIRLTTVDLSGTVKMKTRDAGEPGQRMIAAIIDHPKGAHIVDIVGPARAMEKWAPTIDSFLKSAKAE